MANIASILKSEIARVARKETRAETSALKKTGSAHRTDIAALKRRVELLEREVRRLAKAQARSAPQTDSVSVSPSTTRFSAKGLASQRRRLGLSAHDCGLLIGASSQSVYNWEDSKARPRAIHLAAIGALRTMGRREAASRLESLKAKAS